MAEIISQTVNSGVYEISGLIIRPQDRLTQLEIEASDGDMKSVGRLLEISDAFGRYNIHNGNGRAQSSGRVVDVVYVNYDANHKPNRVIVPFENFESWERPRTIYVEDTRRIEPR